MRNFVLRPFQILKQSMLTEAEIKCLPVIHNFQLGNFSTRLELALRENGQQVFKIELQHLNKRNQIHYCQIDMKIMESNPHLHLFEHPASLFLQLVQSLETVTISDYGEIQFFVEFGRSSKYPITIHCPKKGIDYTEQMQKYGDLYKKKQKLVELQKVQMEKEVECRQRLRMFNDVRKEITEELYDYNRRKWELNLCDKKVQSCKKIKNQLVRGIQAWDLEVRNEE